MALADSTKAIGAVTNLLVGRINGLTSHNVTVGRPEAPGAGGGGNGRLNLFLYEALHDPHLREVALDEGQEPPMWLVLRYLITAFDDGGDSDTTKAHRVLGDGLRALRSLTYLPLEGLAAADLAALKDNPERLKVTFGEGSAELLSKLMQGTDEKYRFSMAFEVRPVMIASPDPASYALLIGIDYTAASNAPLEEREIGEKGIKLMVEPTLGPRIHEVEPTAFQAGGPEVEIHGEDLHLSGLKVKLGPVELTPTPESAGTLRFDPTKAALAGDVISAGAQPLSVLRTLASGRERPSNLEVVGLLPEVENVTRASPTVTAATNGTPEMIAATINLRGHLLGTDKDDIFVALYKDGEVIASFDDVKDQTGSPPAQTKKRVKIPAPGVPTDVYRVIVRVNGQQARQSRTLDLTQ